MSLDRFSGGTVSPSGQSIPEALYLAFMRNEITPIEYRVGTAVWVADHTFKYTPKAYPPVSAALKQYVDQRDLDRSEYEPALSARMGAWVYVTKKYNLENLSDLDLLEWCESVLIADEVKLTAKASQLSPAIQRFYNTKPDQPLYAKALRVAEKDSRVRQSHQRRTQ